jgi:serine-type D-Ala-D-Ala carboxypeptidase (penicillin-binding protein 5/6)
MTLGARAKRAIFSVIVMTVALALPAPSPALARTPPPETTARYAVVVDAGDGHVLYQRAARAHRPIASTTKLMTALLALEKFSLRKRLRAPSYHAGAAESVIGLRPGERMSVGDLLRALLLESANDAAVTLARGAAGSVKRFVGEMNVRAQELGLADTHYANPVGLDEPGNYSSALDLSRLASVLLKNETFAEIVDLPSARLGTGARPRMVDNRNDLVARVPWIDGVKTGHTLDAGWVLVGAGSLKGAQLVSVVLGDSSQAARDADTLALLRYGFGSYRRVHIVRAHEPLARARVRYYGGRSVDLVALHPVNVTARRGQKVRTRLDAPDELKGPIAKGAEVGSVTVLKAGKRVRLIPLVTARAVPGAGLLRRLGEYMLIPALALLIVIAAISRRRQVVRRRKRGGGRRRVLT